MGSIGPLQIILVLVVALLLFGGRGRISSIMGDMAKGIKSFRKGLNDDDDNDRDASASKRVDAKRLDDDKTINVTPTRDTDKTRN